MKSDDGAGFALIGMGPGKVESMTLEAVEVAKNADVRLYEAYTALWPDDELERLETMIGPIKRIMRPAVERPETIFEQAKNKLVAILVVGDPMQATTHIDFQLRAEKEGIPVRVIHGISVTTLVPGSTGLSDYKFGRSTTLTYPYGDWIVTSPLEVMLRNKEQGLHTLVLFDLDPTGAGTGDQRPMQPQDALVSIEKMVEKIVHSEMEESLKQQASGLLDSEIVLCCDLGTNDVLLKTTTVGGLRNLSGGRLNCMVFLANMSEMEQEAVQRWS
ncbi:MAG: diphthine synthase [Candidatus Poseidoniaceae archaeon]